MFYSIKSDGTTVGFLQLYLKLKQAPIACLNATTPLKISSYQGHQCLALNAMNPIQSFYSNSSCVHQNLASIEATLLDFILTKLVAPYHVVIAVVILTILTEVSTPTSCF
jgi:hypothetical protein